MIPMPQVEKATAVIEAVGAYLGIDPIPIG